MKHAVKLDTTEEKAYVLIAYGAAAFSLLNLMPGLPPVMSILVPIGQFLIFLQARTQFAKFGAAQALLIGVFLALSDFVLWLAAPCSFDRYPRPLLPMYGSVVMIWIFNLVVTLACLWMGNRALKGKATSIPAVTKLALRLAERAGKRSA